MKKYFLIFILFLCSEFKGEEIYYLEKIKGIKRNLLLELGLKVFAETSNGYLILRDENMEKIKEMNFKRIGEFKNELYFLTPRIEGLKPLNCGNILFEEENLYLIEMEEFSECIKSNFFKFYKVSLETLKPYRSFEEIKIEKNLFVEEMLKNFDEESAILDFIELVNYTESRYSSNSGCFASSERAFNILKELGYEVEYQAYSSKFAPNVVATLKGLLEAQKVIILIAHLDDMPRIPPAPGANDNGSGSAMVLNLAKIFSKYRFKYTIKFILVTGEEQGLVGSTYYASKAYKMGEEILAILNADMIGWQGDGKPLEEDLDLSYDENSEELANIFMEVYSIYENLAFPKLIYCPKNYYSDHYSFWKYGFPAVMGITDNEGICGQSGSYSYYHTHMDTVENCGDLEFYIKIQRAYLSVLAHLAHPLCKLKNEKNLIFNQFDFKNICPIKFLSK